MATFRAKARAVELLGKGQIADLPTAITELWKNGYDAYAKKLECKLFLEGYEDNMEPLFLLSDDGYGMSEDDITNRWFVLGTDSKARGEKINPFFGLEQRVPMGEKGIGRLSVSYLGPQMLMLTKKQGQQANAVFMDWRILDNYDFYLTDLNIPIFQFGSQDEFDQKFDWALDFFSSNTEEKKWKEQLTVLSNIKKDLEELSVPTFIDQEVIGSFLSNQYHGTTFLIFTPHEQLIELSEKDRVNLRKDDALEYLRTSLSGLHNDLENPNKDFETHFYIYDKNGRYDLIDEFFTQDEMRKADHWLKGEFDENGFFNGELRIFKNRFKYSFRPNRPPGFTPYGPFKIEWGSFEGEKKNSLLSEEEFDIIDNKLGSFGGLYIYRDHFRVLPYGRTESDFLEFEKRRSLGAGYYFFSHRRFMGYISLTRNSNYDLKDKAGREGFVQNRAYREFKQNLIEFFSDIAKRYMRKTKEGDENTLRQSQLVEINAKYEAQLKASKSKNAKTKKAFVAQLSENSTRISDLIKDINALEESLKKESESLQINYNNYNDLLRSLDEKRISLRQARIQKPKGIRISNRQENDYLEYQKQYRVAESYVSRCVEIVDETRNRLNVENLKLQYNETFNRHIKSVEKRFNEYAGVSKETFARVREQLDQEKDIQLSSFAESTSSLKLLDDDDTDQISLKIQVLERLVEEHETQLDNSVGGFINHLNNLQIDVDDDFLRGWYQEQNENLEKKLEDYEELAQLGMSIEIIDHQFNVMYSQMNDAVADMDRFSRMYPEMERSFRQLKGAFQHLEGNYKLLRPLYRTSRRTREVITGAQIEKYTREFFANEFQRYKIDFSVNDAFKDYEFFTYDSIIKPVFLNLINNACYWLIPVNERRIRIELVNEKILILNSGEPIDESYLEDVFTLFFTRKRDGRGIGLYLARKNLGSIGYSVYATNDKQLNKLKGACFVIEKLTTIDLNE